METVEGVATFAGRLATFELTQQLPKRRASSVRKKNVTSSALSWPHSLPSPEQLARAGFYYKPTEENPDSVTCFLCGKSLDGWAPEDIPALEHLAHVPDCGWAVNVCIEQRGRDMDYLDENPLSDKMVAARTATFQNIWPHEKKKGWKCKTKKMVDAGWCFDPVPEGDDCVKCFYCGVSLDGWEPKDDPWDEHQSRAPGCRFFTLAEEAKRDKKAVGKVKRRGTRTSKASRASTRSNTTNASENQSFLSFDDIIAQVDVPSDEEEDEEDTITSMASTKSGAKRATRGRAAAKSSKKSKASMRTDVVEEQPIAPGKEEETVTEKVETEMEPAAPAKKPRIGRAATRQTSQSVLSVLSVGDNIDVSQAEVSKPKAARSSRGQKAKVEEALQPTEVEQAQASEEVGTDAPAIPIKSNKRGKKRTSDGRQKLDITAVQPETEPELEPEPYREPEPEPRPEPELEAVEDLVQEVESSKTKTKGSQRGKSKGTRKATTLKSAPVVVPEVAEKAEEDSEAPAPTVQAPQAKKPAGTRSKKAATKPSVHHKPAVKDQVKDDDELHKGPITGKTAEDPTHEIELAPALADEADTPPKTMKQQPLSPAQSSDAENQPPSSRQSQGTSQNSDKQPVAAADNIMANFGARTPTTSAAKTINMTSGALESQNPWSAVDLEAVLLLSPSSRTGPGGHEQSIEDVLARIRSPEKHLTVEEWIQQNAAKAEERLKGECERLIGAFESEGNRALQAIEGISCV